ncbi:unnamed protein product [Acanthoscelides obtectus]|uniref:Receptor L-domain domain-containing protein n=1 Tax=Acanthoscelides obtectus TaxID=200917 RepID=A0A9P0K8K7_ACAOB|nr:unnamed protein product [Acanthoscelides obtectus]CAK1673459.1 Insulin receptor-related protein [Acanthoscelides obtectus]
MFARENYAVSSTLLYFGVLLLCCIQCQCKVCLTMDVRNVPRSMEKLRNCTEIQGNLMIVLMETVVDESAFDPYTFPELKKISGYLLFFRIRKLTSVAKLFPNLRVIGGSDTILDYSLIIYDMPDIKEVSLFILYNSIVAW